MPDRRPLARRGERRAAALQCSETLLRELSRIVRAAALDAAPEPFSVVLRCLYRDAYRRTPSPEIRGRAQIATVIRKYEIQQRVVARLRGGDRRAAPSSFVTLARWRSACGCQRVRGTIAAARSIASTALRSGAFIASRSELRCSQCCFSSRDVALAINLWQTGDAAFETPTYASFEQRCGPPYAFFCVRACARVPPRLPAKRVLVT